MSRRSRELLIELLEQHQPSVTDAFLAAAQEASNNIQIGAVETALRRGDIEGALDALNITEEAFQQVTEATQAAFNGSGRGFARLLTASSSSSGLGRVLIVFNVRNIEAERVLAERSSRFITAITEDQRGLAREALRAGLERGDNPRRTALDIAGRVSSETGTRTGGIIGLSQQQGGFLANARGELGGDAAALRRYLGRERRDKRFDRTIQKAIRDGTPLTQDQINRIAGRYADRLLQQRAETIALTETRTAIQTAQHEAYRQAIARGEVRAETITKRWVQIARRRRRDTHTQLHNTEQPFNQPFVSGSGALLNHPLDASLGAGAGDLVNCGCIAEYRIDFFAGVT